jgi:microcystin-dependent protein
MLMFMSEPFIGEIRMVPFNFVPMGWALCNGQILQIRAHETLYAIIGNTYGGDGRTTFALPDLRGKVVIAAKDDWASPYALGRSGGTETTNPLTQQGTIRVPAAKGPSTTSYTLTGIQPFSNVQPYLALNFIIALEGVFPPRD